MDDELRRHLDAMMAKLNANHERVLDRLTAIEGDIRNLRSEHSVTRDVVMALPGTLVGAMEKGLLQRMADLEARVGKLESGGSE